MLRNEHTRSYRWVSQDGVAAIILITAYREGTDMTASSEIVKESMK